MKRILITISILTIILLLGLLFYRWLKNDSSEAVGTSLDPKNAVYIIEGKPVELKDGYAEEKIAPDSTALKITRYFGNDLTADLNGDGKDDSVFFLTQESGGSGVFYYVVAALNTESGYVGSDGYFLGDRIAPQNIEPGEGRIIVVNYADRDVNEPFTTPPSIGKSVWLILDTATMRFGIVEPNFEGEANPDLMRLDMKTWNFVSATAGSGEIFVPQATGTFSLTFNNDNGFSASTDCNSVGGNYSSENNNLSLSDIFSTKMFCEGSEESEFIGFLEQVESYQFTPKGELLLGLQGGGEMAFW